MGTTMIAPKPNAQYIPRSQTIYTSDANNFIASVAVGDVVDLLNQGCTVAGQSKSRDNFTATTNPGASNDVSQDYGAGSTWLNTSTGIFWRCVSAVANTAAWVPLSGCGGVLLGKLIGANMNSSASDQAFAMSSLSVLNRYRVTKITAENASASCASAIGGIFTAASKGGTGIVPATQAYTNLSSTTLALDLTIAATPGLTPQAANTPLILHLDTPEGSAATADFYAIGDVYF